MNSTQQLYSPALPVYTNNMNNMNSSFNGSVFGSPASQIGSQLFQQNTQQTMPGQMGYNPMGMGMGTGNSSPPGSFPHMPTTQSFNMANIVPPSQPPTNMQTGPPPTSMSQLASELILSLQGQLTLLINTKFDEICKRLKKLDTLVKKVNDIDVKVSKLWSDLDKHVSKNEEKIVFWQ